MVLASYGLVLVKQSLWLYTFVVREHQFQQLQKLTNVAGGALVLQAYEAHIQWQVNAYKGFKAKGQNVSIAIFSYGKHHSDTLILRR